MLSSNYISVLLFQLAFDIVCNFDRDTLVLSDSYFEQMEKCIQKAKELKPDICVFPEMAYHEKYAPILQELSKDGKLIVFGSDYTGSINKTKIFSNGEFCEVIKQYPCGSEPMVRIHASPAPSTFLAKFLKSHEFVVKGQKIYVLNCLEYYKVAYLIARDMELSKDLFAFIVPCSNSNPNVFMDESKALHNHNEHVYSFVCNRINLASKTGYGRSYVFGPIQYHEKDWLTEQGITSESHNASIITLDRVTPSYVYGEYAISSGISRFGRSDMYANTPINLQTQHLF